MKSQVRIGDGLSRIITAGKGARFVMCSPQPVPTRRIQKRQYRYGSLPGSDGHERIAHQYFVRLVVCEHQRGIVGCRIHGGPEIVVIN